MDTEFMYKLQQFRDELDYPFSPVEGGGYRCENYDGKKGPHTEGKAVDPDLPNYLYYRALEIALELGFTGIGVKQNKGRFQLHLDTCDEIPKIRPRPWVWTY